MSIEGIMMRLAFKRGDDKRDAGLTVPADVRRVVDIPYGADKKWNLLDVYRPKDAKGRLPVIVSVHGGGWVYGDKDHVLGHVFHCNMRLDAAAQCNRDECEYFNSFC